VAPSSVRLAGMERTQLVGVVEEEGKRLLEAATVGLDAPVPACPAWTVADVVGHVASVYRRTTHVLAHQLTERPAGSDWYHAPPEGRAVLDWFAGSLSEVLDQLRRADPVGTVWTFSAHDHTAGFWHRRLAHETTMHRVDVESAHGTPAAVPADVACDGIDEAFDVLIGPRLSGQFCGDDGTVHLHATDHPGEWLITLGPEGVVVERCHAKGTVALRGPASGLLLWLWGRGGVDGLEVFGERPVLDQLRACVARAT
jgi:uncharacterized protein (TIGR03083 family)